jgi:hypothetical protein
MTFNVMVAVKNPETDNGKNGKTFSQNKTL